PILTLFPYTTLFRSRSPTVAPTIGSAGSPPCRGVPQLGQNSASPGFSRRHVWQTTLPGAEPTSTDYSLRLAVAPAHELAYGLLELVLADDALVEQDPDHGLQLDRHLRLVRQPVVRNRGRPVAGRLLAPA